MYTREKIRNYLRSKTQRYARRIARWPYLLHNKRTYKYRDRSVSVAVRSPWEYERATGGFETYALDCFIDRGIDRGSTVYYEIGSCNSIGSLIMSKYLSRDRIAVVSFEPEANNIYATSVNLRMNDASNVVLIPIALSDLDGTEVLHFDNAKTRPGQGGHSLKLDFNRGSVRVPALTVDTAIRAFNLPMPTYVSIDAEGHEEAVAKGMMGLLSRKDKVVDLVVVELDGVRSPQDSNLVNLMGEYGYGVKNYKPSPRGVRKHCLACFGPS